MSRGKISACLSPVRWAAIFLVTIGWCNSTRAQVAGGTLSGTITDPSGAAVPQAQITIRNVATGVEKPIVTNADGFYSAVNLLPGNYQVTVSAPGFNTLVRSGITITVGAQQTLDIALQVGSVTNKVEVTSEAPEVEVTSSEISATVNSTTVRELPLNGRSWTDLAALQPGVDTIHTQPSFATGSDRGNRGFGTEMTISGARPQQNNYRLDGVSLNDYANGAPGAVWGGNLGVDAIQEFSVLTSNYAAEYGKTSGGVVNAITRSGTNAFHGSAYEFLRNSAFDAANFFDNAGGLTKSPFRQNQFGGSVGGPIIKDRTFFFADYEGLRRVKGDPFVSTMPSPAARLGNIHDSSGNPITVPVDPNVAKYLQLYPVPQLVEPGADTGTFTFSGKRIINENFVTTRIDHKFSDRDSLYGTYMFDRTPYNSPDQFDNVELSTLSARQILVLEETHSFTPNLVNSARFGFNHENVNNNSSLKAINPVATDPTLGAFAGRDAATVTVSGLTQLPGGFGALPTYLYRWNSYQGYDDAFWTHGTHSVKFGLAVERMQDGVTAITDPSGVWFFGGLQSFLTNSPTKFQGGIVSSLTPRHLSETLVGGYVQDDWRWKSYLALNLGLRYEMTTVIREANGKLANLPTLDAATPHLGDPFFKNPTLKNFEPRIGFAWDPFHNGKMAVRGGVGLFDVLPLPYEFTLLTTQAAPFFQYTAISASVLGPAPFPAVPSSAITANRLRSTFIDPAPKRNYVGQWNLNIQYQLTPNLAALIAYVGSHGVHQPFRVDEANLVIPTKSAAGWLWPQVDVLGNVFVPGVCNQTDPTGSDPAQCNAPSPINPNYGSVHGMFYQGTSSYNALEVQLAKRMSHGLQMQGVFTWGKSIDTSSATVAGDAFANSISSLNYFDLSLTRGLSDFNVGRTFVLNGTWDVPSPKSGPSPAKWAASGWELGVILTLSDGVPFTPTWGTGGDPANTLSSDDFAYPNRLNAPGCANAINRSNPNNYIKTQCFTVPSAPDMGFWTANCDPAPPSVGGPVSFPQCFNVRGNSGRNVLTGPGITDLDFSVFKNNSIKRISENFNVQFRMEIFNILNRANFTPPNTADGNTDVFDATGAPSPLAGVLVNTTVPERQIQFALKFIF